MASVRGGVSATAGGYWRGSPPRAGGTGSGAGPAGAGARPMSGAWNPTVVGLLGLVIAEMAAYAGLRWAFRQAHGG